MRRAALIVLAHVLAACAGSGSRAPSAPAQAPSELIFSHAKHGEQGVECASCHKGIAAADALGRHLPTMKDCAECHESEVKEKSKCGFCHRDLPRARKGGRPATPGLRFSHKQHAGRAKDCVSCHTGAAVATTVAGIARPKMRGDCFTCHGHLADYRKLRCTVCHESLARQPLKFVSAFNHEGNFLKEHGRQASAGGQSLCASCHAQSYCAECHAGARAGLKPSLRHAERVDRRFIHEADFKSRHAIEARAASGSCLRCHGTKSCQRCHEAEGVSAQVSAGGVKSSPHPSDWLSPGSPNSHGRDARRRITQCAGCHDQGSLSNCVRCHKSATKGGLGIKPHPAGWRRGGKGSDPLCLMCH